MPKAILWAYLACHCNDFLYGPTAYRGSVNSSRAQFKQVMASLATAVKLARQLLASSRLCYTTGAFNQPKSSSELLRVGGIASLFRLPIQEGSPEGLDACFVGIPSDSGSNYRPGTRLGPRAIRNESVLIRYMNITGAMPFESLNVADIGDVPVIPYNPERTMLIITEYYHKIVQANCVPLTMGGEHCITYPILKALGKKHGPMALVQIDSHPDFHETKPGEEKYINGRDVLRRAIEDGLVDTQHMVQIGLRGSMEPGDLAVFEWAQKQGIQQVSASQCWHKSLTPLMEKIRSQFGDRPTYITFDMDGIDANSCPGVGTMEVGGLTPIQAMEIVQGLKGMNIIGADLNEVNPLNDTCGITSLMAANLMFEMLCVLPGVKYADMSSIVNNDLI